MKQITHKLNNDHEILIREATAEDAGSVLDYIQNICGESDFLTFGPGEFEFTKQQEKDFIEKSRKTKNSLFILGQLDGKIVSVLNFSGGQRKRIEHCGEFGMTVQK